MVIGRVCAAESLVIVTVKCNSSVLSQPFQMYLFLQATIQNTRCQLALFSSSVNYWIPKKTAVMQISSISHKAVSISFINCLQSDTLEAVAPKK